MFIGEWANPYIVLVYSVCTLVCTCVSVDQQNRSLSAATLRSGCQKSILLAGGLPLYCTCAGTCSGCLIELTPCCSSCSWSCTCVVWLG